MLKINPLEKKLYLDPSLYKKNFKRYSVFKASYSKKMYSQITFAMIKPGLGLLKSVLRGNTYNTNNE